MLAVAPIDAPPNLPATVREIPVEVVTASPAQEKSPAAPEASHKSAAPHEITEPHPQPAAAAGEGKPQAGLDEKPKPASSPSPPQ